MFEALKNEIAKHGHQAAIVPIERLQDIRQDLVELKGKDGSVQNLPGVPANLPNWRDYAHPILD